MAGLSGRRHANAANFSLQKMPAVYNANTLYLVFKGHREGALTKTS